MRRKTEGRTCVGTGFIVLDVIRTCVGTQIVERRFAGGSCGNVLAILAYFGWMANAVGRIGDDHSGRELVGDLKKWGVRTDLLRVEPERGTPIVIQENYVDARGLPRHRFSRACPECGAWLPSYRPLLTAEAETLAEALPSHSVFYFDRVAPGTLELAKRSRAAGALVVFEPSGIKDERLFSECLKVAHIVKYASDRMSGIHGFITRAKVPIEVETRGAKGLRLRVRADGRAGAWTELTAFSASDLRDAAGSGDWCTAGLIHGLMDQGSAVARVVNDENAVVRAIRQGQALAALNCGFEGARGLMYAADARRVLDLARAIVEGTKKPEALTVRKGRGVSGRRKADACVLCSSHHGLHS